MSDETLKRPAETANECPIEKKAKQEPPKGIQEEDVGITQYISAGVPGFKGSVKQRYTDFLVNEIGLDGKVLFLEDEGFEIKQKEKKTTEETPVEETREEWTTPAELRTQLVEILGEDDVAAVENVMATGSKMETSKVFEDKATRTKIHQLIREAFDNKLESVTSADNKFNIARAHRRSRVNKKLANLDENGVANFGLGPTKDFLHFTCYKENKDTMDAAHLLSKFLRLPPKNVRYAGTKDRRAATVQRMCLSRIGVERVNTLNKTLKGIRLGGFAYEDTSLGLGDLQGNEFCIAIRDAETYNTDVSLDDIVSKSVESLREKGFINYFGMQRFGTFSVSTHEVGKQMLLGKWREAGELILSEQEIVLPKSVEARRIWKEKRSAAHALNLMPRQCVAESCILRNLINKPKDAEGQFEENLYLVGIMQIPRNLRIMYGHAYQSYVWNAVASKRIELFGLKIVEGDLIIDNSEEPVVAQEGQEEEEDFEEDLKNAKYERARPVTQQEIDEGKYTIYDVVLPTPGFDIVYPTNEEIRQVYVDVMGKDGLDPFDMRRKVKEFSFAGSYRVVMNKPKNVEYKIIHYESPVAQLINTDYDILKAKKAGKEITRMVDDIGGSRAAVVLKLQLGVSAYATMALRELMKAETSRNGEMCDVKSV